MITVRENEHDIDSISRNHEYISRIAFQKRQVSLLNIQIEIVIIIHSYYKNKNRFFDFFLSGTFLCSFLLITLSKDLPYN